MNTYRVTWHADGQPWVETVDAPNRRAAMWHVIRGLRDLFAREGGPEIIDRRPVGGPIGERRRRRSPGAPVDGRDPSWQTSRTALSRVRRLENTRTAAADTPPPDAFVDLVDRVARGRGCA